MSLRSIVLTLTLTAALTACEDDPIIGPGGDDDTGGGSYGVIHFRAAPGADVPADSVRAFVLKAPRTPNPQRF